MEATSQYPKLFESGIGNGLLCKGLPVKESAYSPGRALSITLNVKGSFPSKSSLQLTL